MNATLLDLSLVDAGVDQEDAGRRFDTDNSRDHVFELRGTKGSGTSLDVKIQDSFDGGTTWNDVVSFTQLTADGSEPKVPGRPLGGLIRALRTSVGNGWTATVRMAFNSQR